MSPYFKICDEEINLKYEDRHYRVACLRAISIACCLICSLPSGQNEIKWENNEIK
jgi:hypothetical protein